MKIRLFIIGLSMFISTFPSGIAFRASFDSTIFNSLNRTILYDVFSHFLFATTCISTLKREKHVVQTYYHY